MVEIKVMGPIQGFRNGEPVDIGGPTQRRLLASLVAQVDEVVPVRSLLEGLWGEDPPPSGPASIQSYVSRLRKVLGSELIETTAPGYRLASDGAGIDSLRFLERASNLPGAHEDRLEAIESALELWRGPPFEDFDHVEFASRRLYETRFDLEEERARLLEANGQGTMALSVLEKITAEEPLRESAWVTLGLVLARLGRQAEAVRALDRYRANLVEIGLQPGADFEAAEAEVFEGRSSPTTRPDTIPRTSSSFVGRTREVSELVRLLGDNSVVTVVGPGGMGKTRLAIEAAATREPDVVFVRLESLRDQREVAPTVLHALGGETRGDPTEAVLSQLARRPQTLLVFDNVEHVIDTTAGLVSAIAEATDVSVLITSREPLNTPDETVFTLGPLDAGNAIELYRERARSVEPGFEAPSSTLDMLCEEMDYMPLAIEMAAARSKALMPDEILERIHRRYGLFDKPLRGGAERHRSLDALVDWSYDLLDPPSQRVFERLSVVAGSFDSDVATTIAGFGAVSPDHVASIIADLVEKSLIERTSRGGFRMLRVLKSFAGRRLELGPDLDEARTRHAHWFGSLASQIGEGLATPDEAVWIGRANASVEDLGSALRWSAERGDLDVTQQILEGLFDWFYHRHPPAITDWGDAVIDATEGHDAHSAACAWASLAAVKRGDLDRAYEIARRGTVVDGPAARFAWFMTGDVACYQDHLEEGLDAFRHQLVRASNVGDQIGVIDGMTGETLVLAFHGQSERAKAIAGDLDNVASTIGAPTYRAYSKYAMAEAVLESDPQRAAELLDDAVGLATSVNNLFIQAVSKTTLGSAFANLGEVERAIESLHGAIELWDGLGVPTYQWAAIQFLGAALAQAGQPAPGARLLAAADSAGRRPFTAGQSHWIPVVESLRSLDGYEDWVREGSGWDLATATAKALVTSRPRP